jgi:hypothetical protein
VKPIELIRAENSSEVAENKRTGFMGRLWDLVRKAVDCCIE